MGIIEERDGGGRRSRWSPGGLPIHSCSFVCSPHWGQKDPLKVKVSLSWYPVRATSVAPLCSHLQSSWSGLDFRVLSEMSPACVCSLFSSPKGPPRYTYTSLIPSWTTEFQTHSSWNLLYPQWFFLRFNSHPLFEMSLGAKQEKWWSYYKMKDQALILLYIWKKKRVESKMPEYRQGWL